MAKKYLLFGVSACLMPVAALAAVIGTNEPARPLTTDRLATAGVRHARFDNI